MTPTRQSFPPTPSGQPGTDMPTIDPVSQEPAPAPPALPEGHPLIQTPDQRLRVFVSSTLGELPGERLAVSRAISALRLTPVLFELGARPHPPQDLYRAYLAQSDVFIGLYWQCYGQAGPGMQVSGLEEEFDLSRGLPRLRDRFDAGAVFVPLAEVTDPRLVLSGISRAMGADPMGTGPPLQALAGWLGDDAWLLILDNLEQVLEVASDLGHDYHDELTGVLASSLAKRAPGYTSLGFPDPRKLPYTPSANAATTT
jgi:Domain of unknown function (DUF4062)